MNENASASSSSDDEIDDETDNIANKTRQKRDIAWCGVDTEGSSSFWPRVRVQWPPPSTSTSNWRELRPVNMSRMFGTKMQLYSRTGHHLAVYPDGRVAGTPDENDLHTYLEVTSAGHPGHVRIKGLLTNLYIAMDEKGRLYGEPDITNDATIFVESFQGSYNTYLSVKYAHLGWYLGIKKSGKFKRGPKTKYGQKAIRFLPRRSKFQ